MAQSLESARRSGQKVVDDFNKRFTPNTPCFYQYARGEDKWYPTRTRSEAWLLGHGEPVVQVDGTSGCVCISHLAMPGSDRYEASVAEAEEARGTHNADWVPFDEAEEASAAAGTAEGELKPAASTVTALTAQMYSLLLEADASASVLNIVSEFKRQVEELQEAGQSTLPRGQGKDEELAVYQYAISVATPRGEIQHDGILQVPMIETFEDYQRCRAEMASDVGATPELIQVRSMALIGSVPAAAQAPAQETAQ